MNVIYLTSCNFFFILLQLRLTISSFAFSSVFIFFEAFRLTLVKKNRQNEESRENVALYRE